MKCGGLQSKTEYEEDCPEKKLLNYKIKHKNNTEILSGP